MDTITLVEEQIDDGRRLLDRLGQEEIPVRVACWVKPVEEDRWSLYVATPVLDEKGAARAYREVYRVLRSLGNPWITDSDIKLIGENHPITRDVLEIQQRHPGRLATRSRRPVLGGLPIEEMYVYPSLLVSWRQGGEERRLKKDVEQVDRPEDFLLTPQEKVVVSQLVAQGMSEQQAYDWVHKKRERQSPRPPIPAGTVVRAWVAAYWGDRPEDDPNPLLRVKAPDGGEGLAFKEDTEPINGS